MDNHWPNWSQNEAPLNYGGRNPGWGLPSKPQDAEQAWEPDQYRSGPAGQPRPLPGAQGNSERFPTRDGPRPVPSTSATTTKEGGASSPGTPPRDAPPVILKELPMETFEQFSAGLKPGPGSNLPARPSAAPSNIGSVPPAGPRSQGGWRPVAPVSMSSAPLPPAPPPPLPSAPLPLAPQPHPPSVQFQQDRYPADHGQPEFSSLVSPVVQPASNLPDPFEPPHAPLGPRAQDSSTDPHDTPELKRKDRSSHRGGTTETHQSRSTRRQTLTAPTSGTTTPRQYSTEPAPPRSSDPLGARGPIYAKMLDPPPPPAETDPHWRKTHFGRVEEQKKRIVARDYVGLSHVSKYKLAEKLGEGTFGVVYRAVRKAETAGKIKQGDVVALKEILLHNESDGMPITSLREIRILKSLDHPCIVPVVDMVYEEGNHASFTTGKTYMAFPYMDHDLAGLLENPKVVLNESHVKQYAKQLVEGTAYLHANGILHRDMKAANLLIDNNGRLMIADFGLARSIYKELMQTEYTLMVVTRWYRPPELLLGLKKYHTAVDMWGVGCVMLEMFNRKPVFVGTSDLDQAEKIFAVCGQPTDQSMPGWSKLQGCEGKNIWNNHPTVSQVKRFAHGLLPNDLFVDLISKLLTLNPKARLTAQEALDHEWFWADPHPCPPSQMKQYNASHELDKRQREEINYVQQQKAMAQQQQPLRPPPFPPQPSFPQGYHNNNFGPPVPMPMSMSMPGYGNGGGLAMHQGGGGAYNHGPPPGPGQYHFNGNQFAGVPPGGSRGQQPMGGVPPPKKVSVADMMANTGARPGRPRGA